MNSTFQKIMVIIIAILVFVITFVGSSKEQVVVEANKIVTDSNNIDNNYLVGPKWLSQNLDESNLVILDIRSEKKYKEGHVPGAINAPVSSFIKNNGSNQNGEPSGNWTNLLNKKEISTELQNLGITQNSDVVIYGQSNAKDSQALGEISWIFKLVGINSRMLNGGYENWIANGLSPVTTEPIVKKSNIEIENFVTMKALNTQNLGKNVSNIKLVQLVNDMNVNKDAESTSENTQSSTNSNAQNNNQANGNNQANTNNQSNSQNNQQTNTNNPQANTNSTQGNNNQNNAANNVIQIKLSELLNPNGTLKPVDKLDNLFEGKGISPNNIILFYNTNNGNLAFLTLVLEMAGFEKIQTYDASLNQILSLEQSVTNSTQSNTGNNNTNTQNNTGNNSAVGNNSQTDTNDNNTQNASNNSNSNSSASDSTNSSTNSNSSNSQ